MPILNVEFRGVISLGNSTVHVGYGYYEGAVISIIDSAGNGLCNTMPFNVTNVPRTLALQSSSLIAIASSAATDTATYAYNTNVFTTQYFYCGNLPTGVDDEAPANNEVNIFPNPTASELRIQSRVLGTELRIEKVEIYNVMGEKVFSQPVTGNQQLFYFLV